MSRNLISFVTNFLRSLETLFPSLGPQSPAMALAGMPNAYPGRFNQSDLSPRRSIKDIIGDGILWAVPKHRRTVEKRLNRKFGYPEYNWRPLRVKTHLRNCNQCGHDYEAGILCTFCYDKVRKETKEMQEEIQKQLGLSPVEQDVIVLYEGERTAQHLDSHSGKRIVEMPKPRPLWFNKNLLQKTTQQTSETKEVKPNDLA